EDGGDGDAAVLHGRGARQGVVLAESGARLVGTPHVVEIERDGGGGEALEVQVLQATGVFDDGVEQIGEAFDLIVVESQASDLGHAHDGVTAHAFGHGGDVTSPWVSTGR